MDCCNMACSWSPVRSALRLVAFANWWTVMVQSRPQEPQRMVTERLDER